jgi:hypothetical protein
VHRVIRAGLGGGATAPAPAAPPGDGFARFRVLLGLLLGRLVGGFGLGRSGLLVDVLVEAAPATAAAATPAASASCVAVTRRASSCERPPTPTVVAASPFQPSTTAPQSMLRRSPSRSFCPVGRPWTTTSLVLRHSTPL